MERIGRGTREPLPSVERSSSVGLTGAAGGTQGLQGRASFLELVPCRLLLDPAAHLELELRRAQDDLVAVLEEAAGRVVGKPERLGAVPTELDE